ncbi:MAG: TPM domain-containing protein [Fimbriimonadales bacterium]|nr:TPM domain-containing protein [Fimbriimonadales bacterium]
MKCPRCGWIAEQVVAVCLGCGFSLPQLRVPAHLHLEKQDSVNDFAGLLSESERTRLAEQLHALSEAMGGALVLATVPSVAPLKPSEYAFWLYHFWQLPPNGLLLLVALQERWIESEVGLAWEPFLSDVETGDALQAAIPLLKEGRYAEGLLTALQVIELY